MKSKDSNPNPVDAPSGISSDFNHSDAESLDHPVVTIKGKHDGVLFWKTKFEGLGCISTGFREEREKNGLWRAYLAAPVAKQSQVPDLKEPEKPSQTRASLESRKTEFQARLATAITDEKQALVGIDPNVAADATKRREAISKMLTLIAIRLAEWRQYGEELAAFQEKSRKVKAYQEVAKRVEAKEILCENCGAEVRVEPLEMAYSGWWQLPTNTPANWRKFRIILQCQKQSCGLRNEFYPDRPSEEAEDT